MSVPCTLIAIQAYSSHEADHYCNPVLNSGVPDSKRTGWFKNYSRASDSKAIAGVLKIPHIISLNYKTGKKLFYCRVEVLELRKKQLSAFFFFFFSPHVQRNNKIQRLKSEVIHIQLKIKCNFLAIKLICYWRRLGKIT